MCVCVRVAVCGVWLVAALTAVSDLLSGWCVLQPEKHGPGSGPPPGGFRCDGGAWRDQEGPQRLPARHWPLVSCWSVGQAVFKYAEYLNLKSQIRSKTI